MLKWAVNESHIRQSQVQTIQFDTQTINKNQNLNQQKTIHPRRSLSDVNGYQRKRDKLRRKSSGHELTNIRRKILIRDKENHLTSTPLPSLIKQRVNINSPVRKLDSLKDLSNITTESFMIVTPNQTPTKRLRSPDDSLLATPNTLTKNNNPLQYATTLPTFDVEYSPCGAIPGPLIALRGISIADSYFEKPRYLPHEFPGYRKTNNENLTAKNEPAKRFHNVENIDGKTNMNGQLFNSNNDDESLSSSKMGDTTLDKMIDAILESARKDRRIPKSKQLHIMSPTYTPADDPASDLNEFWDEPNSIYRQNETKINNINLGDPGGTKQIYNEREVRTPDYLIENLPSTSSVDHNIIINKYQNNNIITNNDTSCHLRRQRAVRRKRRLSIASTNFIKSTVKNSAQKFFAAHNSLLRKNNNEQILENSKGQLKEINNFSPDSGRNSASDFYDSTDENHCTKRRLSFSPVYKI